MQLALDRPDIPTRRRFDVDAYYRIAEAGILSPGDRVELIDGEVIEMAPISSMQSGTTIRLTKLFAHAVADGHVLLSVRHPLRLDRFNEPQPELMLLRPRADFYESSHPTATNVLLLIEVADSSLAYDRGAKLTLYARHGVPEVWIVDLQGRAIEVCRQPDLKEYEERQSITKGEITPALVPTLTIDVSTLPSIE